jgi:thiosulfate/3-mercaptopyruvate sulfurtransferase
MKRTVPLVAAIAFSVFASEMPLIQPKDLAANAGKAAVLYVGPNVLYRSRHVSGAIYAGPGSTPQGLDVLKNAAAKLPREREVVIYCGCCPWDRCPNIRPALEALRTMGFAKVKVAYMETGFKADWIDKGYPVESGR